MAGKFILNSKKDVVSDIVSKLSELTLDKISDTSFLREYDIDKQSLNEGLQGDNYYFIVRALSKSLLPGVFYLDFRKDTVLQDSYKNLLGRIILSNHERDVNKWVGKVIAVRWNNSTDPNGIDAIIRVPKPDSKYSTPHNSAIVKGLLDGSLNSFSVGLEWEYEMSHPDMDVLTFLQKQGEEIDNNVVRFVAKKIKDFNELSIVWAGYDNTAKVQQKIENSLLIQRGALSKDIGDISFEINSKEDLNSALITLSKSIAISNIDEDNIKEAKQMPTPNENNASVTSETGVVNSNLNVNPASKDLDKMDRMLNEYATQLTVMKKELNSLKESNIVLDAERKKLEEENRKLNESLTKTSYDQFVKDAIQSGHIVKAQLLEDTTTGKSRLERFYNGLDDNERTIFMEFVKASPLPQLAELNKVVTPLSSEDDRPSSKKKMTENEWVLQKISELAKRDGKSVNGILNDGTYNKYQQMAMIEWKRLHPKEDNEFSYYNR